jgi:hypothetical protein
MKRALVAGMVLLMVLWIGVPRTPGAQTPAPLTPAQIASLPVSADRPIDFVREIKPILQASCVKCHGRGRAKGGFSIETRASLLEGGDSGPAIVPGTSQASHLIALVAGLDPDNVMPQKGSRLKPEQIGLLRAWIDQGAPWDPSVSFAKAEPRNIDPRQPALPDTPTIAETTGASGSPGVQSPARVHAGRATLIPAHATDATPDNPIDRLLAPYFAERGITPGPLVDDRQFARRVYLDTIGLLPSPDALQAFVADRQPDKRQRLVARLLADRQRYADHWLSFWNDALRNDYRGPGFIDGGRQQISRWLYTALLENLPYDRFVAQLINPAPGAEGFTKGIIWRGVVNASQTPPMQAAQNVSQVFMGVNLKCASCHDSFINDWQLADAYGLAGIYADKPLEMVECDRPTGRMAPAKFLYAKLGGIDAKAARAARLQQLAGVITGRQNGRLSRTIVNRLWARFMGRGLVEPVDDMEQPAWDGDLLDWLAEDLVAHGYDLKHTMARILTSRAYQMAAVDLSADGAQVGGALATAPAAAVSSGAPSGGANASATAFRGPAIRRMSAEQFADAISMVTGVWQGMPAGDIDFTSVLGGSVPALRARWIWRTPGAHSEGAVTFRKTFLLASVPASARALVAYDEPFVLNVNGKKVGESRGTAGPSSIDIRSALRPGQNLITLVANRRPPPVPAFASTLAAASAAAAASAPASAAASVSAALALTSAVAASADAPKPTRALVALLVRRRTPAGDAPLTPIAGSDGTWQWKWQAQAQEQAQAQAQGQGQAQGQLQGQEQGQPQAQGQETSASAGAAGRGWRPVADRGGVNTAPASLVKALNRAVATASLDGRSRAALVTGDSLTLALGRPNREQVVTSRATTATTLQALELANGATLTRTLQAGAERLLADKPTPAALVTRVYQRALGRDPTPIEAQACRDLLGPTLRPEGVQDLLWAIAMLPEFQLID